MARVNDLTDGRFCERVIEAIGKQEPLDLAGELTAERGRLVIEDIEFFTPRLQETVDLIGEWPSHRRLFVSYGFASAV